MISNNVRDNKFWKKKKKISLNPLIFTGVIWCKRYHNDSETYSNDSRIISENCIFSRISNCAVPYSKLFIKFFFEAMQVLIIMDQFNMHENPLSKFISIRWMHSCPCGFHDNFIIPDVQTKLLDWSPINSHQLFALCS